MGRKNGQRATGCSGGVSPPLNRNPEDYFAEVERAAFSPGNFVPGIGLDLKEVERLAGMSQEERVEATKEQSSSVREERERARPIHHQRRNPQMEQEARLPLIGEKAPSFKAETTQGPINFPEDFKGKWLVFFSHPADFTPVCTTEFMTFATMQPEFEKLNCKLLGLSIDSTYSHIAWLRTVREKIEYKGMKDVEVNFPVISDLTMEVSRAFGMLQPAASTTQAVRAVFIIDPKGIVRSILYYPLGNGRNVDEIKRLLVAMQLGEQHNVATPANWQPGEDVIIPPPGSCGSAKERVESPGADTKVLDWFMVFKKCPK